MERRTGSWRRLLAGTVLIVVLVVSGSAQGFYFKGWPGDGIPKETILVNPKAPPYENPPGTPSGPETEPPRNNPKENPPGVNPPAVPEPATGLAAVVGLAVLGIGRRLGRRRRSA
jgi:hypothetical protein